MISYEDFTKIDIRVGRVLEVHDFPEMRKPSFKLKIDFGPELGIKWSSAGIVGAYTKEELVGMLVCGVVNFPPKKLPDFMSEVLTLGFANPNGTGFIPITPARADVEIGSKLA